jgi:hypothetical protein
MKILLVPKVSECSAFLRPQGLEVTKSTYWSLPRRGIFWWLQRTTVSCPDIKLPVGRVEYKNGGVYIGTTFNGQLAWPGVRSAGLRSRNHSVSCCNGRCASATVSAMSLSDEDTIL